MFQNPFSFDGRIRRTEYGISMILYFVVIMIINVVAISANMGFLYILYIPVIWFIWAQGTKRCHDRGNSAWYQLIPFYGFWMLFADGDPHENVYGADPKGRGDLVEQLLA